MGICSGISMKWLFIHCFQIELEFRRVDFFVEGGKPENLEKNPWKKDENQQQTQPTYDAGSRNQTRATLVGGECSHHCTIPAPPKFSIPTVTLAYESSVSEGYSTDSYGFISCVLASISGGKTEGC